MVGGHGEGGGGDSELRVGRTMNIFFLIPVEFIVSQGNCESRDIIYDHSANSVMSVFKIF